MKLKFAVRTGAMVLAWSITQAHSASWYVGYGAEFGEAAPAFESVEEDWKYDSGMGNSIFTGIAFNRHWALEFGYTEWGFESKEIIKPTDPDDFEDWEELDGSIPASVDEVEKSFSIGMRTSYPIIAGLSVEWGTGLHRWTINETRYFEDEFYNDETGEFELGIDTSRKSESDVDFYYYAGAKYQILPTLEAGLAYSKYNTNLENIDAWRLSISYYFSEKKGGADALDPRDVYVRGLLTYNRAKVADEWRDFTVNQFDEYGYYVDDYRGKVDEDTTSIGFSALVGFNLASHWSVEAGYIDLGDASLSASVPESAGTRDVKFYSRSVDAFSYGIAVNFSPYSRVSPYFRIGMLDWNQDIKQLDEYEADSEENTTESDTIDSVGTYLGFGISFGITPQLAVITELNRYAYGLDADDNEDIKDYTNTLSVGVQYRFAALERPQPAVRTNKDFRTYPAAEPTGSINRTQRSLNRLEDNGEASGARSTEGYTQEEDEDDSPRKSKSVACDPRHKHLFFDCE